MSDVVQLIVSGIATGSCYALAALGFTLLWQASGTINFALGEMVMLPAFIMLFFLGQAGLPLPLAFGATMLVSLVVLGFGFKRAIVDPMIRHGVIPLVIATQTSDALRPARPLGAGVRSRPCAPRRGPAGPRA